MKYRLYPWQEKCLKKWCKNHYRGIVNVVTGSGKTYLALAAAGLLLSRTEAARLRIRIVVPTASLLTQWVSAILDFFDGTISRKDIGLYHGGRKDTPDHLFSIYVINSARYSVARHAATDLNDGFTVFLIADECHRYVGDENRKIFDFLPFVCACPERYASLGLSATPGLEYPENAAVLIPALGQEIFRYGFKEAEKEETLCPCAAFHIALSFTDEEKIQYEELSDRLAGTYSSLAARHPSLKGISGSRFFGELRHMSAGDGQCAAAARLYLNLSYKRKSLTSDAAARIECVLKLISLLDRHANIIIFGERIEQADILCQRLGALYPNQVVRYHSSMDIHARKLALRRFQDGEARILISCRALDEGFDIPLANVGIVMSSTSVNRQRIQRLGRILRRYEGKKISSLYYLYVASSSEEASYFPAEFRPSVVCELSYCMENNQLLHPTYEELARSAMQTFRKKNPDGLLLSEAGNCLALGLARPDWMLGEEYCRERINRAKTVSERNYWICMRQIGVETLLPIPASHDINAHSPSGDHYAR